MASDLAKFIQDVRLRNDAGGREWYWEKNANRPQSVAYALEYNPVTLLLKTRRYISRRRMLAPLMASNRPSGIVRDSSYFSLWRENGRPHSFRIQTADQPPPGEAFTRVEQSKRLSSGNRKLIILHAFYEREADAIFEKLDQFVDYDVMLTTPVAGIRERFLAHFDASRSVCFFLENVGRDVLPFLLLLAFQELSAYRHFIKIHTKRSSHLSKGSNWFSANVEVLIGDKRMTDRIFDLIDAEKPGIYGIETRPLHDHFRSNRFWLQSLLPNPARHCEGRFVPGTMFAGSAEYLRRLATAKLHLNQFEEEKGQLDGCLIHALERYFGYFAQASGGECAIFDRLIERNQK
jgi:hypothetical protein